MEQPINDSVLIWGDSVIIITRGEETDKEPRKGVAVTKYICDEYGESMTFGDAVQIAKENGFTT